MALDFNFDFSGYSTKDRLYLYRDIDMQLAKDDNVNKLVMREDLQAISKALKNIFSWHKGSRPIDPNFGLPIELYIGDLNNTATYGKIVKEIKAAIATYEIRVRVKDVSVISLDDYSIQISVKFTVPTLDDEIYTYEADLGR